MRTGGTLVETSDVYLCETSQIVELYQVPSTWDLQGWNQSAGTEANPQHRVDSDTQTVSGKGPFTFYVSLAKLTPFIAVNGQCVITGQLDKQPTADQQATIWYPSGNTNDYFGDIFWYNSTGCTTPPTTVTTPPTTVTTPPTTVTTPPTTVTTPPTTVTTPTTVTVPTTVTSSTTSTVTSPTTVTSKVTPPPATTPPSKPTVITPHPAFNGAYNCKTIMITFANPGVTAPATFAYVVTHNGAVSQPLYVVVPGNGVVTRLMSVPGTGQSVVAIAVQYRAAGFPTKPLVFTPAVINVPACVVTTTTSNTTAPVTVTLTSQVTGSVAPVPAGGDAGRGASGSPLGVIMLTILGGGLLSAGLIARKRKTTGAHAQ